jgi:hypothetical protein
MIAEKGEDIIDCPWLIRRLRDGDLVIVEAKPKTKKAHQPKKKLDPQEGDDQASES